MEHRIKSSLDFDLPFGAVAFTRDRLLSDDPSELVDKPIRPSCAVLLF